MCAQHCFFGFEAPKADGLFFGLFPPAAARTQLTRTVQQLRIRHRLGGRPLAPERFHVSLLGFGRFAGLPQRLVAEVVEAAATLTAPRFEVSFDRAMSFLGTPRPLVLRGGDGVAELIAFQRMLGDAIQRRGLGRAKAQFTPHVTLLYDERGISASNFNATIQIRYFAKFAAIRCCR